ncbi:MAG: enoyl-CoA hydratase/isomerase family protein [Paracoccus sp.]|jgi:3-hydroxyacyl-CoA dehydrogenase|nr:enoyl-CoA hydratase/isomerase family protein [Paracoccus sp. (in: a-proteobacteria)]MBP9046984.1 enoyl-CoA hydratase/isomerase family protein [Tabrizicola sp.]
MTVTLTRHGDLALVTIDNPPVNALGATVRSRLLALAEELDADPQIRAVLLTGAGKLFVGGADITEFDAPPAPPHLPDVIARIEAAKKPWIAVVNGLALGGGAELALGCAWRLAAPAAQFGLPEVTLGLIPGAGGTQRLPRLIGVEAALPVVTGKRRIAAHEALQLGLVDAILRGALIEEAMNFARSLPPLRPPAEPGRPDATFWDDSQARITREAKGTTAPLRAFEAVRHGIENGRTEGLRRERVIFLELRASPEAAALRHLFFAERAATSPGRLKDVIRRPVLEVGVVGGGTMGVGIAAALTNAGLRVALSERDGDSLTRAMDLLEGVLAAQVKRGMHSAAEAAEQLARVMPSVGLEGMASCDLVIEAVFEDLAVKREVFAGLAQICRRDAILATNTSYLDPEAICDGLAHPERCIGLHFFSPAQVMKLLEIVPLTATSPETLATAFTLARQLGKIPVRAGNCEGFIGNRIIKRYRAEAETLLREGQAPAGIDAAMRGFGFAMGPFEMQDMAGLDIAFRIREAARARGEPVPEMLADRLVRAGRLGQKTGAGWFDYASGDRHPKISPVVAELLGAGGENPADPQAIAKQLIEAMADEGRQIVEEGFADGPDAIDLVMVHGYGFPRARGGLLFNSHPRG